MTNHGRAPASIAVDAFSSIPLMHPAIFYFEQSTQSDIWAPMYNAGDYEGPDKFVIILAVKSEPFLVFPLYDLDTFAADTTLRLSVRDKTGVVFHSASFK